MPPIPLVLPTGSVKGKDGEVANARLVNGYAELIERDGKASYAIYTSPGLTRFDNAGTKFSGAERGMIALDENTLIAILGNQIGSFDGSGNFNFQVGAIAGSTRCILARDRAAPVNEIGIVTQDGRYYLITGGNTLAQQSISNLPAPNSITYLAGRFLYGIPDGRIFCSHIDDGTAVDAASFDTANAVPGNLVCVYAYGNYLYVFKTKSIEIWVPDPSLANAPFPYSNTQTTITLGCLSAYSIAQSDNGLFWIDDNGIVRYGTNQSAQRVSTHTVERAIASLSQADKAQIIGTVSTFEGHKVYTIKSTQWTFQFDLANNNWNERNSYGIDRWRVNYGLEFAGKYVFGDETSGKLYFIDTSNYTEDGNNLDLEIWCGAAHRFPGQMIVDAVKVDFVAGVGLNSGLDSNDNPALMIDFSDDGGKNFQGERQEAMGAIGDYGHIIESWMWGLVREKGRIWRFRGSAAVLKSVIQAYLVARPVRG